MLGQEDYHKFEASCVSGQSELQFQIWSQKQINKQMKEVPKQNTTSYEDRVTIMKPLILEAEVV